jgi:hypothetical protein
MKFLKEEIFAIPALMVLVEIARRFLIAHFPDSAFFDPASELETYLVKTWQFLWLSSAAWLLLRVVFPDAFYTFKNFYSIGFSKLPDKEKSLLSLKIWFAILFLLILLFTGGGVRATSKTELVFRKQFCDTLHAQLNVRELTGNNDGAQVMKYLSFLNFPSGTQWCGAYASYNLCKFKVPNPKSGRAANFSEKKDRIKNPLIGDNFTLAYNGRVTHVGFFLPLQIIITF